MTDPTTESAARERLADMIRTDRGDMNVYSESEVRAALDAYRAAGWAPAASAVSLPPADQTALRDRIAAALRTTRRTDYEGKADHGAHRYDARCALCAGDVDALTEALADAVLPATTDQTADPVCRDAKGCHRVVPCEPGCGTRDLLAKVTRPLPAPVDRAAVLREAIDRLTFRTAQAPAPRARLHSFHDVAWVLIDELRRMADETQPASTAPLASGLPLVKGNCPSCGAASLFLGNGGYVTCSRIDCPEPDAASTTLEQPAAGARQDGEQQS